MSSNFPAIGNHRLFEIGNYHLLEKVGGGTFGQVYRAKHKFLSRHGFVAAKLLNAHPSNEKERESFLHEVEILEKLEHPHILPILDAGIDKAIAYIITEFALGGSLRKFLLKQAPQLLPLENTIRILTQIAEALQTAHHQEPPIVHRDLKPENILLDAKGNALLADFGLAKILSTSMQQASFGGTLAYMAPEQFEGNVGKRSDQYALGCIAYELVTGKLPSRERLLAPRHFNPRLSEHVSQAILKALAKEYDQRHIDVMSFIKALSKTKTQRGDETLKHASPTPYQVLEQTLDPTSPVAYTKRGTALYKLKRYEDALAAFNQALRLNPEFMKAHNGKGNALYELRRYDEALAAYDHALRLDPQDIDAHNNKELVLKKLKKRW